MEIQALPDHNLFLIDWLTVTTKIWSENDLIQLLHLEDCSWEHLDAYRYGYAHRCSFSGITIMSGGREDMGICLEMSGQGCRAFETYSDVTWLELLRILKEPLYEFNVTHIDIAFDDHTGILDIGQILDDTDNHRYRSRSRWWKVEYGSCGTTIYHGSPQSNIRVRIYDKAAERGLLDGTHWIRVELVLRDVNASGAIDAILEHQQLGPVFSGILSNYLVYCDPSSDSNRSRWQPTEYWQQLLDGASAIHIAADPGLEYNIFRLESYLRDQCGGAIFTWAQIYGLDSLENLIKVRRSPLNPKHRMLLEQHKRLKEGAHEEVP